jgi:catechol 2,3-dioxygenase-like lactoylglutathione lyase family enzyme
VSPDRAPAQQFLLEHGADRIDHPGGTLFAHLGRVADQLAAWGAADDVVLAGLCHATYGTAGFATALLPVSARTELSDVIGPAAEAMVYLYASCDRAATYPLLGGTGPADVLDRFSGQARSVEPAQLRAFMEITVANELDVIGHNADYADRYSAPLLELFTRARERVSRPAWAAAQLALQPVVISHLDHLVLTVADLDRTVAFYRQALGMTPVVFEDGRHALEFGDSKINLHVAGQEIAPYAERPMAGSADLCLIAATPLARVIEHLGALRVPILEGPVPRTGARGLMSSVYLRDPDGNLVEISNYG